MNANGLKCGLLAVCLLAMSLPVSAQLTTLVLRNQTGTPENDAPVTFGQVFSPGDVPNGSVLAGTVVGGGAVPLQVDAKARHADGSLRHAVISTLIPSLSAFGSEQLALALGGTAPAGADITVADVLATTFDTTLAVTVGGSNYSMSARDLLTSGPVAVWLSGPVASEWLVGAPLRLNGNGADHPHLTAYFHIRAYQGLGRIRVSVVLENNWSMVAAPRNFTYDATVTVEGPPGVVLSQNNVTHYRQARWRRVVQWGPSLDVHVEHDPNYLASTLAVPTYDSRLNIPESTLVDMDNEWSGGATRLMNSGFIETFMPQGGGRRDIGPLPRWTARYLITQDARAKRAALGNSEQAGSFGIHYRDRDTGLPISLDTFPDITRDGNSFPACGGNCNTPYEPDMAHQPSLSYVPYLVTGDYFHLEELQFWANWNTFYWPNHGGSLGLVVRSQVRSQAWGLRTIAHAAFITPDDHPMKAYFIEKLNNNLDWYDTNYTNNPPTPLGYVLNHPDIALDDTFATWMDDFLTWTVGHIVNLEFANAIPFFLYKAEFPLGRMINPDYCWILASTYWTRARVAGGQPYQTWRAYKTAVIESWDDPNVGASFAEFPTSTPGMSDAQIPALDAAGCDSQQMANILGLQRGDMIGYSDNPEGYTADLQPAVAMIAELGVPGGDSAWTRFDTRTVVPDYDFDPHFAVVPADLIGPGIYLAADPFKVSKDGSSTLTWTTINADSCTASGGWTGGKLLSGSETVGPIASETVYTLSCVNAEGQSTRSVRITIDDGSGGGGSGSSATAFAACLYLCFAFLMRRRTTRSPGSARRVSRRG